MIVIPGDSIIYCDVDDTLILWNPTDEQMMNDGINYEIDGTVHTFVPHKLHVENLKKHKMRQHTIVIWSAGGVQWAETAVKILKLEKYVDLVISKPKWCYDDLPPEKYMPKSQWLEDK